MMSLKKGERQPKNPLLSAGRKKVELEKWINRKLRTNLPWRSILRLKDMQKLRREIEKVGAEDRPEDPLICRYCWKTLDTSGGRASHERYCHMNVFAPIRKFFHENPGKRFKIREVADSLGMKYGSVASYISNYKTRDWKAREMGFTIEHQSPYWRIIELDDEEQAREAEMT